MTTEAPAVPVTAKQLLDRLRAHYAPSGTGLNGGVLVPEVGWNGVRTRSRRCDAIYIGFTSTSGRVMIGHEVKVSRSDWLHELAQSTKADEWEQECAAWYVVAPDGIVKIEELPSGWGLLTPGTARTRLTVRKRATVHAEREPSWDAVRSVIARMDTLRIEDTNRTVQQETAKAHAAAERQIAAWRDAGTQQVDGGEVLLKRLSEVLGLDVSTWSRGSDGITFQELGGAFRRYVRADRDLVRAAAAWNLGEWQQNVNHLRDLLGKMQTALRGMAALQPPSSERESA